MDSLITDSLDALTAAQNEDGGWGWWEGGASDPEISSYILFGLVQAQNAGVFVDELLVQQATGYMMATLPASLIVVLPSLSGAQRPANFGRRFSAKADTASWWSLVRFDCVSRLRLRSIIEWAS